MLFADKAAGIAAQVDELAAPRTIVSEREAERYAWERYRVSGKAKRLATEKDDTFRLDCEGQQYILKIANPSEKADEIDLQVSVLRHLEYSAPDLPVPRVHLDIAGQATPVVEVSPAEQRLTRLLSYIPGVPLDGSPSSVELREDVGRILAEIRHALSDFSHHADNRVVAWDVTNVLSLTHLITHVDGTERRRGVERTLAHFESILPKLAECRRQVLHNDFNTNNIVVSAQNASRVGGIIDFGDAVRTAIAVDVSTALINQMPKQFSWSGRTDLFDEARDVLRGYLHIADLTDEELRLIPFLALGRIATRILLTYWRAKLFPENAQYILRHTEASWPHMDWFLSMSPAQISELLINRSR